MQMYLSCYCSFVNAIIITIQGDTTDNTALKKPHVDDDNDHDHLGEFINSFIEYCSV